MDRNIYTIFYLQWIFIRKNFEFWRKITRKFLFKLNIFLLKDTSNSNSNFWLRNIFLNFTATPLQLRSQFENKTTPTSAFDSGVNVGISVMWMNPWLQICSRFFSSTPLIHYFLKNNLIFRLIFRVDLIKFLFFINLKYQLRSEGMHRISQRYHIPNSSSTPPTSSNRLQLATRVA